ncbi:MAG: phosphoenolpyruvate--protein phosphotransferase [Candidatus Aureabacteria bacterium]|nr:phosphoenolpyruvate--protein phosphotransferase [Candidatus Auribacterota bacterium]
MQGQNPRGSKGRERAYRGIGVSPGVAIGKAFIFDSEEVVVIKRHIDPSHVPLEITRFEEALIKTRQEILNIQRTIGERLGIKHAEIFNAHLLVLEDRSLIEDVIKKIERERYNIEYVFQQVGDKYADIFSQIEDDYLKERASDIRDVTRRVLHNLLGKKREDVSRLTEEVIIVAYDLSPSDTALMHKEKVISFATDIGAMTSHTAIMARSLNVPAVVGLRDISQKVTSDEMIIVDGTNGVVIASPTKETLRRYLQIKDRLHGIEERLVSLKELPAETLDGYRVALAANIELPEDVPAALAQGAEGVGLYRTEFFYMNRKDLPTEDEQFEAYRKVAEGVRPHPVIIRTLDLGGDKFLSNLQVPREMNPFLGYRAIRFCLGQPDIFKTQLRAILRASILGNVKVMFPMISGVDEVLRARELLEESKEELRKHGKKYKDDIEVGAMIEIPSAALTADIIAKHVDFFSIGTNDLIQYSLAVDRVNEKIAYLYEPRHPAILRLIKQIITAGHRENIWVGMCGEMAGEPSFTLILLGMGLDEFSVSVVSVPEIKRVIRSVRLGEARAFADEVLGYSDIEQIKARCKKMLLKVAPELLELKGGR